ncbi:MAG TPA: branched-chain amino acid ABC transporter permease [Ramlibacter sp.]|nr:branched-chain amino acid ABC transporter permease [Ramlibacter sp.]
MAAVLALLAVAPLFIYPVFMMKFMCMALFAAAFNLMMGYGGLLSFGHAAFYGTGAYLMGHALKAWGLEPLTCLALSVASAALLGLAFGFIAIRRKGIAFSMITLALAQLVAFAALRAPFTGGEDGIQDVPRGRLLGVVDLSHPAAIYLFVMLVFALGMYVLWRVVNSPFGHVLEAIRANESRALSLGYDIDRYKLIAFTLSAAVAGLAGGAKTLVFQLATLSDVGFELSGEVLLMVLLGGVGTLFGPLVGAGIVILLESYFASSDLPVPVMIGSVFILCVLLFRRGIVGEIMAREMKLPGLLRRSGKSVRSPPPVSEKTLGDAK